VGGDATLEAGAFLKKSDPERELDLLTQGRAARSGLRAKDTSIHS
jgi:hypothetical protein